MLKRFIFLIFTPFLLFASNEDRVDVLSDLFQTPSGVVADCVNVITGHYFLNETDFHVPGPNPITYQRFYNSGNHGRGSLCPGWDDNYHTRAELYKNPKSDCVGVTIYEGMGGLYYWSGLNDKFAEIGYCSSHLKWGVTNGTSGVESARRNIMNRKVEVFDGNNPEVQVKTENGEAWIFYPYLENLYGSPNVNVSSTFNLGKKIRNDHTYEKYNRKCRTTIDNRKMFTSLESVYFHHSDNYLHAWISFNTKLDNKNKLSQI